MGITRHNCHNLLPLKTRTVSLQTSLKTTPPRLFAVQVLQQVQNVVGLWTPPCYCAAARNRQCFSSKKPSFLLSLTFLVAGGLQPALSATVVGMRVGETREFVIRPSNQEHPQPSRDETLIFDVVRSACACVISLSLNQPTSLLFLLLSTPLFSVS